VCSSHRYKKNFPFLPCHRKETSSAGAEHPLTVPRILLPAHLVQKLRRTFSLFGTTYAPAGRGIFSGFHTLAISIDDPPPGNQKPASSCLRRGRSVHNSARASGVRRGKPATEKAPFTHGARRRYYLLSPPRPDQKRCLLVHYRCCQRPDAPRSALLSYYTPPSLAYSTYIL
jgi:hypothetical protein